jgi:hypothetical protein
LPDFSRCMIPKPGKNVPNAHKMYQMKTKCTKWKQNVPKEHKMYQMVIKYVYQISVKYSRWP